MPQRRRTRHQKAKDRKRLKILAAALAVIAVFSLAIGLRIYYERPPKNPAATLHQEGQFGYIPVSAAPLEISISAPQAFVYDCSRAEIIYQKGEEQVLYPASTTKLLTILCALQILSPEEIITPGEELSLVEEGSSLAYIKSNHRLSVEMLIQGMLLPSGNDAAYVLAAAAGNRLSEGKAQGASAVEAFLKEMEAYAASIGLVGTTFTSPDGLAGKDHYSTVEDMLLITRLADRNEIIRRYCGMHSARVTYESGHQITWENTNALLDPDSPYYRACVSGLKTGSLDRNYCVIASAEQNGRRYLIGVFGARDKNARFADAAAIIDHLFAGEVST